MKSLGERCRWMIVPIAAYLAITLALPIANGAAGRVDFARHAGWVLGGCVLVVAAGVIAGLAVELGVAGARRLANNRRARRVSIPGGRV